MDQQKHKATDIIQQLSRNRVNIDQRQNTLNRTYNEKRPKANDKEKKAVHVKLKMVDKRT